MRRKVPKVTMDDVEALAKEVKNYQVVANLFASPAGQEVLKILRSQYFDVMSFNSDPITMAYHEGQRKVVKDILDAIELNNKKELKQ